MADQELQELRGRTPHRAREPGMWHQPRVEPQRPLYQRSPIHLRIPHPDLGALSVEDTLPL